MALSDYLHAKVGPVPVPVIGLVVVGGGLYFASRGSGSSKTTTGASGAGEEDGSAGDAQGVQNPVFLAKPNPNADSGGDTSTASSNVNNDVWAANAIDWLVSSKHYDFGTSNNAIHKFLAGDNLSFTEGQYRDQAVQQFGPPPDPIDIVGRVDVFRGPATRQGTPPTKHVVKGANDNTVSELAFLYYGTKSPAALTAIRHANRGHHDGYQVGETVTIPKWRGK